MKNLVYILLPKITIPEDFVFEEGSKEAEYLGKLVYEGAAGIYGTPLPTDVEERLRYELDVIKNKSFPGYFLFWHNLINAAEKELGVWVGPGRGSATGCLVNYCLGITKIDPIKHGLLFERFLNPDRMQLPDIDMDFDKEGRGKVLQWLKDKYGEDNCTHIAVRGMAGSMGIHPCGIVVAPDAVGNHVPVTVADDPELPGRKVLVTQCDSATIESIGLVKFDLLELGALSEIKECVRIIKQNRGIDIDINHISVDDEKTFTLYQEGRTTDTFMLSSPSMQNHLRELRPTVFGDLVAMNALYRPGAMDSIPSFIARKNGYEEITYDLPIMEKYLSETYGIVVYQEQIMKLASEIAGFTQDQSDTLRQALGKRQLDVVDMMKPMFIEGGEKNGYDTKTLEKIWRDWKKIAPYTFCKAHAVSYTWLSYQTVYLKAHYPTEYMTALLCCRNYEGGKLAN